MNKDDHRDSNADEIEPGKVIVDNSTGIRTRSLILQVSNVKILEAIETAAIAKRPPETVRESPLVATRMALHGRFTHLEEMEDEKKEEVFGGTENEILEMYHDE